MSHSQVAEPAEATASETPPQDTAATLELTPEILAQMSPELRTTAPATTPPAEEVPAPPDDEDAEPEPEDELPEEDEASDESADEEDEETSPDVADWVNQFDENPNVLSRIPGSLRKDVVQTWRSNVENAATAAVTNASQIAFQRGRDAMDAEYRVKAIDAAQEDGDVMRARELMAEFPGGERNYYLVKAKIQPVQANSPESFNQRAAQLVSQLANNEAAAAELQANWNYTASDQDMMRLALDVGRLLEKHSRKQPDKATQELERRKEAQARRKATPRPPDVSEGVGNSGKLKIDDLKRMSAEQVAAMLSDPVKSKEIDEVLAGSR